MNGMNGRLSAMRDYFKSDATQPVAFRKQQLLRLKQTILKYEEDLNKALFNDLHKSKEEIWITETGLVLSEINFFLKHIDALARPRKTTTNLLNLPGKSYILPEPLGVVLIIAPWNYPFQLLFLPLIGAIAAGNCVVLKPSEFATQTEAVMQKIIEDSFEMQYVRYITGNGAVVIPQMMEAFRFDHIFYTGSTAVGRSIYQAAAAQLIPVTLELGGKNPCLITPDANLNMAARKIALTKFSNAGQMCVTADYLIIHESAKQPFLEILEKTIIDFYGVHPAESYDFGRIINKKQFDRLLGCLGGATIILGGTYNEEQLYIAPTVVDHLSFNDHLMKEEIFGPILPVISYQEDEEVLQLIEQNPNPLAFYIFTNNKKEAAQWLRKVPSGGAGINCVAVHYLNKNLPFGGRGNSGTGRYHGKYSFDTFSHQKAVLKAAAWPDLPMNYPSFKGRLRILKKLLR